MAPQKIAIGQRVLLPNGTEAAVKEAWNAHQQWGNPHAPDEWEYHVEFPGMGLGGRLNFKESELRVWVLEDPNKPDGPFVPRYL